MHNRIRLGRTPSTSYEVLTRIVVHRAARCIGIARTGQQLVAPGFILVGLFGET